MVKDAFNFVFFFSIYNVRWGCCEEFPIDVIFSYWGKKLDVKLVVNLPLFRKLQFVCSGACLPKDFERSFSPLSNLL